MRIGISYSSVHLIMVFLIKIARKNTAFNKICTHHQYFFLNKKLYYETVIFNKSRQYGIRQYGIRQSGTNSWRAKALLWRFHVHKKKWNNWQTVMCNVLILNTSLLTSNTHFLVLWMNKFPLIMRTVIAHFIYCAWINMYLLLRKLLSYEICSA